MAPPSAAFGGLLESGLVDDVGLAAAEFRQLGDVVGREAGGLDDRAAELLGDRCPIPGRS
jgi:hypothetical protein